MDHARDIAYKIAQSYMLRPANKGDRVTADYGGRERTVFIVLAGDGGAFRVTVEQVRYDSLPVDEMYLDDACEST